MYQAAMKYFLSLALIVPVMVSVLTACNPDVFVSDESVNSATVTINPGDSSHISVKTEGLRSVSIDFEQRVQMCFYDKTGNMFDRSNNTYYTLSHQLSRLSRATFSSGLFSASASIDIPSGSLWISAAGNMSESQMVMTVTLRYDYSERVLTYIFRESAACSYEVVGIEYSRFMEGYGNNQPVFTSVKNDTPQQQTFTISPFSTLMRSVSFTLSSPYDQLDVTIPSGTVVPIPSLPPAEESGGVDLWGYTAGLQWGVYMIPSLLQDRQVRVVVPAMTAVDLTFKLEDICIFADVTYLCRRSPSAASDEVIRMKGTMWVYDDSFYTTSYTSSPIEGN